MVEIALLIGCVVAPLLRRLTRSTRPANVPFGESVLATTSTVGFIALSTVCVAEGVPSAAVIALVVALIVNIDVRWMRRAGVARLSERHASTVTPFQNAT